MKKRLGMMAAIVATFGILIGIVILICNHKVERGTKFTVTASSLVHKLEEVDTALLKNAGLDSDTRIECLEIDLYKDTPDLIMVGQLYNKTEDTEIHWNYFDSVQSGTIHVSKWEQKDVPQYLSWSDFMAMVKAVNLDELIIYNGEHVSISYQNGLSIDRQSTEAGIRQLGYYIYKDGACTKVTDMSLLDGEYTSINIAFGSNYGNMGGAYSGIAELNILMEQQ